MKQLEYEEHVVIGVRQHTNIECKHLIRQINDVADVGGGGRCSRPIHRQQHRQLWITQIINEHRWNSKCRRHDNTTDEATLLEASQHTRESCEYASILVGAFISFVHVAEVVDGAAYLRSGEQREHRTHRYLKNVQKQPFFIQLHMCVMDACLLLTYLNSDAHECNRLYTRLTLEIDDGIEV